MTERLKALARSDGTVWVMRLVIVALLGYISTELAAQREHCETIIQLYLRAITQEPF